MRILLSILALIVAATPLAAKTLTVYTYDSFVPDWGPGPKIKAGFEATCGCTLEFVGLEDAVAILGRLRFEGASTKADVVVGLDTNLVAEAKETGLFAAHGADLAGLEVPRRWADDTFVPYDFGYFAFIYDETRLAAPPASLKALVDGDETLIVQDPRSSSPGLGLMLWMRQVFGDGAADAWAKLAPRIVTVTNGWSEAYGLFLKGEADMVLSYTTSPAYHAVVEGETFITAAPFTDGHYLQMELAAVTASSAQPELARRFIAYLTGEAAQSAIPTTNWMFPVNRDVELPDAFGTLIQPQRTLVFSADEAQANRKAWIAEWLAVMGE